MDEKDQNTQVFIQKYKDKFKTIPTLENFAYQGYDITRFFLEMICHDAIAYPMTFDKTQGGGYENVNIHFLEIKDDEIVPVTY